MSHLLLLCPLDLSIAVYHKLWVNYGQPSPTTYGIEAA